MSIEALHIPATKCDKPVVIGWFLGALAWRTCGQDCAASGMGATTQRKKLAYNGCAYAKPAIIRSDKLPQPTNVYARDKASNYYSGFRIGAVSGWAMSYRQTLLKVTNKKRK